MKSLCYRLLGLCLSCLFYMNAAAQTDWEVGAGIHDITGPAGDTFLVGYGTDFPVNGIQTRLWSRAFVIKEAQSDDRVVFVSTDLHSIPTEVKLRIIDLLQIKYGEIYTVENVMITATHTHSGPGGFHSGAAMLSATSGSDSFNTDVIVDGIYKSISEAHDNLAAARIDLDVQPLRNITRNRSEQAFKNNPNPFAPYVNDQMTLLRFTDFNTGTPIGVIDWFAVHNVSLQDSQQQISGDNKGLASQLFEMEMGTDYTGDKTFVAAFANSELGDVTPNFCGPLNGCGWTTHESALWSARKQYEKARDIYNGQMSPVTGDLDLRYRVIDMPNFTVDERYAVDGVDTKLCEQSYGLPFMAGSGWDGPSFLSSFIKEGTSEVSDNCYSPKIIAPYPRAGYETKIPFQLFRIGDLAIIAIAGEMTTMSGRLLQKEVQTILQNIDPDMKTVIAGLANSYHGYITTPDEYNQQRYEGGHTVFGPNSLPAYIEIYSNLAAGMALNVPVLPGPTQDRHTTVHAPSNALLNDAVTGNFGDVIKDADLQYFVQDTVDVSFKAGSPRNDFMTDGSFFEIRRFVNGNWEFFTNDNYRHATFVWERHVQYPVPATVSSIVNALGNGIVKWLNNTFGTNYSNNVNLYALNNNTESTATIRWKITEEVPSGQYMIIHQGYFKLQGLAPQYYKGQTRFFDVYNPTHTIALENLEYGKFLSAEGSGGGNVNIEGNVIDSWEQFGLIKDGLAKDGCVRSGDTVGLRTRDGFFVSSLALTDLNANPDFLRRRERHVINFPSTACLTENDIVTLKSWRNNLISATQQLQANPNGDPTNVSDKERFRVHDLVETRAFQISLKAPNGNFLTAPREGASFLELQPPQDGTNPDKTQKFNLVVYDNVLPQICDQDRIGLNTDRNFYLQKNDGGLMSATGLNYTEPAAFKMHLSAVPAQATSCLTANNTFNGRAYIQTEDGNFIHNTQSTLASLPVVFSNNPLKNSNTEWEITTYP